jgi:hypothetical protein
MLMTCRLPLSVSTCQPLSVGLQSYRIRMASDTKNVVRENVRALLKKRGGEFKPKESGVSRLMSLGIANGTAQRILDEDSDYRLETLDQVAAALRVSVRDLITPGMSTEALPFRDLDPFESQLVTLFRRLPSDQHREQHLALLSKSIDKEIAPIPVLIQWASGRRTENIPIKVERRRPQPPLPHDGQLPPMARSTRPDKKDMGITLGSVSPRATSATQQKRGKKDDRNSDN